MAVAAGTSAQSKLFAAHLRGNAQYPQGEWGNIIVLRSEVITLAYGRPKPKPRKSRSPYAVTDARLYPRMELLIQSGKAASSYAVAKAVAHRAEGTEMGDHKVRRLQPGFDKARNR